MAAEVRTLARLSGYWLVCRGPTQAQYQTKPGRPVRSTVPDLNALIVSASSGSSPATSNNSAFSQHSNDSLKGRLWSWTASLSGFFCQTLFPRAYLL